MKIQYYLKSGALNGGTTAFALFYLALLLFTPRQIFNYLDSTGHSDDMLLMPMVVFYGAGILGGLLVGFGFWVRRKIKEESSANPPNHLRKAG